MRAILCCAVLIAAAPAHASGGASCASEGGPAKIELEAGITHGMGGPVFSLAASADITDDKVAADLRTSSFGKEQLAQYWLDGSDLRFLLYRERDAAAEFGSVEVVVTAKSTGDESVYAGTYVVKVHAAPSDGEGRSFEGRIRCSVE